jgi:hypothetical protein
VNGQVVIDTLQSLAGVSLAVSLVLHLHAHRVAAKQEAKASAYAARNAIVDRLNSDILLNDPIDGNERDGNADAHEHLRSDSPVVVNDGDPATDGKGSGNGLANAFFVPIGRGPGYHCSCVKHIPHETSPTVAAQVLVTPDASFSTVGETPDTWAGAYAGSSVGAAPEPRHSGAPSSPVAQSARTGAPDVRVAGDSTTTEAGKPSTVVGLAEAATGVAASAIRNHRTSVVWPPHPFV